MNKMKITVRGIKDGMLKDEVKAIIREFCDRESVYARGFWSGEYQTGHLRGVEIFPTGSKSRVGVIIYDAYTRKPKRYTVIKRRKLVKAYSLTEWGEE